MSITNPTYDPIASNEPKAHENSNTVTNESKSHRSISQQLGKFAPTFTSRANQKIYSELIAEAQARKAYIESLEALLLEHHIDLPDRPITRSSKVSQRHEKFIGIMKEANEDTLRDLLERLRTLKRNFNLAITFRDLGLSIMASENTIPTVGTAFRRMIMGSGPKHRVDLLKGVTGRILPKKMTLLLGPPGSGKSLLLKALCGRLEGGGKKVDGSILYNGESADSDNFILRKLADYIEQDDTHAATLTVKETLEYAWKCTTGGHHSYAFALDDKAAKILDAEDKDLSRLNNVLVLLGLNGCRNTYVGDNMIRGVSGGQKRRVTLAEMLLPTRSAKFMDCITNGLDSATTFDIIRTVRDVCHILETTCVISLLQPPPEVFDLFDEIMLLSEGQIIFHGPRDDVIPYFESIGYYCPKTVDVADFLQEIPKLEGHRFIQDTPDMSKAEAPRGTTALVGAWKVSAPYQRMLAEIDADGNIISNDVELGNIYKGKPSLWPEDLKQKYASSYYQSFKDALERQYKLTIRDTSFVMSRVGQSVVVAGIAGSLFSNITVTDTGTLSGFLFFSVLFGCLSGFSMMPIVFAQKAVFYKHSDALFYPTSAFTFAQAIVLYPLQLTEAIAFSTIMYWSAGLSSDYHGSRFLTFVLINFTFAIVCSQFFRLVAFSTPSKDAAGPIAGLILVLEVLFSGFIQPKSVINNGWIWFYWLNPLSYAIKAITINELLAPEYDFLVPTESGALARYGDVVLEQYGNPTDEAWIWYCFLVLIAEYVAFFILSNLALEYMRSKPTPPPPIIIPDDEAQKDEIHGNDAIAELPFDVVSFSFKDIWYTVTLPDHEELDLLRGVSGFFEPGTMTALMGSSGAGKTTLLDVLSGRKNTGVVKGDMFINGKPKDDHYFRHIAGYVEQFDSLSTHDTAREAIEFSAALRLNRNITVEQRNQWVDSVLTMLELTPLEHTMVGKADGGGMSFEQKKRVSIGVELAANPSILFLDEPTTGLDSRAAQIVTRSIRRVASSGRSVVCTIHQPSTPIFTAFDSLLLLRRGGQTVFFGPLGEDCANLIDYFSAAPSVSAIRDRQNPATWMLEVIGAGTGNTILATDFHSYYKESELYLSNSIRVDELCSSADDNSHHIIASSSSANAAAAAVDAVADAGDNSDGTMNGMMTMENSRSGHMRKNLSMKMILGDTNASYDTQFYWLMKRVSLSYWRTPSYNLIRFFINIIIGLIFASAYPQYEVHTPVAAISKSAVIYITVLFCGVVGMQTVIPVTMAERPAFYREQQSEMYSVAVYSLTTTIIEIPYLILSSLCFTLPFFYIVGFQNQGNESDKFGWYWLFQCLYMTLLIFLGQFFVAALPTSQACDVAAGFSSTILSLFCGFMIREQNFPTFWLFLYWLNPLHYAIEGLNMSQFHDDHSVVETVSGATTTAEQVILAYYSTWKYTNVRICVLALFLFIIALRVGYYYCLSKLRHESR